jgi:hypothetical protein
MLRTILPSILSAVALISISSVSLAQQKSEPRHRAHVTKEDSARVNRISIQDLERMMPENRMVPKQMEKSYAGTTMTSVSEKKAKRSASKTTTAAAEPSAPAFDPRALENMSAPQEAAQSTPSR